MSRKGTVWIIDFNVFGPPTEPLLFEWDELLDIANDLSEVGEGTETAPEEFRIIEDQCGVQPSLSAVSRVPFDFVDVQNIDKIRDLIAQQE